MSNLPLGAEFDPSAPFNEEEGFKTKVSVSIEIEVELELPEDYNQEYLNQAFLETGIIDDIGNKAEVTDYTI